ncbi:MAG: glycogen operon protein GlgX homolog [Nitrospira sp.]
MKPKYHNIAVVACLLWPLASLGEARGAIDSMKLGARYDVSGSNVQFRVFSARAERIELYLYEKPQGVDEAGSLPLVKDGEGVWSITIPTTTILSDYHISGTVYYGYRAWGPNWPYQTAWTKGSCSGCVGDCDVDNEGNRFNPNKLLLDPYALEVSHDPQNATYKEGQRYATGPDYRCLDSGQQAPKGMVLRPDTTSTGTKPTRALKDDIIYEVHLRGLTKHGTNTDIPSKYRGTYRGAALKVPYLKSLGVTAVELLPVQESQNDMNDVDPNSGSGDGYWGYDTHNYFAPDRRYSYNKSPGGPTKEFKAMVKAFHDAGMKVFIDVVYNHTGEGYAWRSADPFTYNVRSWRGLDNPTYYSLSGNTYSYDNTGVGGNYNSRNPIAQNLIVDSLAYWRDVLGVDGFRFDLASVLGNKYEHDHYEYDLLDSGTAINRIPREITPRPNMGGEGTDLIAEPWAYSGSNNYQVGNFPSHWSEWNGKYRDVIRQHQNKLGLTRITPGELARRLSGSPDLYMSGGDTRKPWNSINFIVAHDGLTLKDLYTCNLKRNNQAWPFGPSDGGENNNMSWDQGGNPADQRTAARNGLALLMLSAGTPMITGGDEFLRSLRCNNNPYNLDSRANWLSYNWDPMQKTFHTFAKRLVQFRKDHPALRPSEFYRGDDTNGNGIAQLSWHKPDGSVADEAYWDNEQNYAIAYRIDGTEFADPASVIYVGYNGWSGEVAFTLPQAGSNKRWYRVMDTSAWNEGPNTVVKPGSETILGAEGTTYNLKGRAVLLLIAK